jgi:hypothetical protein
MDAHAFRAQNFRTLYRQFCDANTHLPQRGLLKLFAEQLELSAKYLSHLNVGRKEIGTATARHIEARCGKPHGWLDLPHGADAMNADERMLVEQILSLYRTSPDTVKLLMAQAVRTVLAEVRDDARPAQPQPAQRARVRKAAGASTH